MNKIYRGYPFISFEASFVEIEQYVGRKRNFSKKFKIKRIHFFAKISKNLKRPRFFFKIRNCSYKLSFETSFVEIEHMYWQKTKIKKK